MADVQALDMDLVTEKSNHNVVGMMPSVCLTPAPPAPVPPPIPYPIVASVSDGIADSPMRTKVCGVNCATVGSVLKACHGNEPGTMKEVVSLNTAGPVAPTLGAVTVLIELGMAATTGSMADMNKAPTPGAGASASDAGGAGGGGGAGAAGGGAGGGPSGPSGPAGGGSGDGGSSDAAAAEAEQKQKDRAKAAEDGDTQEHIDARKRVAADFYKDPGGKDAEATAQHMKGIDFNKPVKIGPPPPIPPTLDSYQNPGQNPAKPGEYLGVPGSSPTARGIAPEGSAFGPAGADGKQPYGVGPVGPKDCTPYTMDPNTQYMQTTASGSPGGGNTGGVPDTWSTPKTAPGGAQSYETQGGATQYYVPGKGSNANNPPQQSGPTTPYGGS